MNFMSWQNIKKGVNKLKKYNFILRPYPHASDINLIKAHIEKNSLLNFRISNNSLINDIKKSFAVIFLCYIGGLRGNKLWKNRVMV